MDTKTRILIIIAVILGAIGLYSNVKNYKRNTTQSTNSTVKPTNSQILLSEKNTAIVSQTVMYYKDVKGFYVHPKEEGTYPGIVMIHEWWGLNENIKDMAKELAKEGYNVLAVDLYKGSVAKSPQEARQQTASVNPEESLANMRAAVQFLEDNNSTKIASLGWCFGGGQSLYLSLNEPLDATVLYYGTPLITDKTKLESIKWPVLGIFGDQDQAIPVTKVNEFKLALTDLEIQNNIVIYPGVGHAFANPTGQSYAPAETKDAWLKTLKFLEENLKST